MREHLADVVVCNGSRRSRALLADQIELVGQHLLRGKLRANVSAAFSSAGGFTGGQLGAGSSSNSAIVGACPGGKPSKP